ncbi:DUF3179 domain-containing protein [Nocardioides salsibiostraticola]
MSSRRRRSTTGLGLGLALALLFSACATEPTDTGRSDGDRATGNLGRQDIDAVSALDSRDDASFPTPLIPLEEILSGGPPPDGIPSLDDPQFDPADEVDWLSPGDPVLSLTIGDETRGYPVGVLTWHEIANDTVGGVPVAVTYCPLCNSGVAFERTVEGEVTTFGVSGLLYADNLIMYDRATESLWPQLTGVASVGVRTGTELTSIPIGVVGWEQFQAAHPEALVLSRDTGFDRNYGANPYEGYDDPRTEPFFALPGEPDQRLQVKERVVGVGEGSNAVAVPRSDLEAAGVALVEVDGGPVTLWHLPGQVSALDTAQIADGASIGTVAAFDPTVPGRGVLEFERTGKGASARIVDTATGSTWDAFGTATDGELTGTRLDPVEYLDTFWFSWVIFQPDTGLQLP